MFLRKKGQSTAEYAVLIALIAAVVGGFLSTSLKGGIRQKNKQATDYLLQAGNEQLGTYDEAEVPLYTQEHRKTNLFGLDKYKNEEVMAKGGAEKRHNINTTETDSVAIETIDSNE